MDILTFYRGLLAAAGLKVGEGGEVLLKLADVETALTISGQQLMLPTPELLSKGLTEDEIAFHPLCEGIARKESSVLKRYRKVLQYRLNWVMAELLTQIMDIAVDTGRHGNLSPDQASILTKLSQADKKTFDALTKVIGKVDNEKVDRRLISIYLKRPGFVGGKDYPRAAIVTFPFLECMKDSEASIFGVKMRQKDKEAIVGLFLHILPSADEVGHYSCGTNDLTAPNLHALTLASVGVMEKFNSVVALYSEHLDDAEEFSTDLSYITGLEFMAKYRALVPELRGNAGEKLDGNEDSDEDVKPTAQAKVERPRMTIGFPPPDKERPTAPAAAAVEPIRRTNDQPAVTRPTTQANQFPAPGHTETPQQRESSARRNTWMDTVRQQQPAPGYAPPPQYHQPPPGYYQQPAPNYAPPPGYHQPPQGYAQPPQQQYYQAPPPVSSGTPGRNAVAYERQMQHSYYQQAPAPGYHQPPQQGYYQQPQQQYYQQPQ